MKNARTILNNKFQVLTSDLDKASSFQKRYGGRLEQILVSMGALSEDSLPSFYSELLGLEIVDDEFIDTPSFTLISDTDIAYELLELEWYVVDINGNTYSVIAKDPLLPEANQIITRNGCQLDLKVATEAALQRLKVLATKDLQTTQPEFDELSHFEEDRLRELADEAPTVNLLNSLISRALRSRASDMHLEPVGNRYRVRYRIDGVLHEVDNLAPRMRLPIASRIKILAGMDIAEKRRPQDGKIAMKISNEDLDIRVSALPLNDGESIVMRFLRQESVTYSMEVLGLSPAIETKIREDLEKTAGVILLTGPTGSGKTTSLYTFLNVINSDAVKIITLEDPVEYQLAGVNQVQVQPAIGFDFAAGLRSIVRQDPDVIMVGEIRDAETAQIAMQSALTGHLVFSTVHTNDAPSAYTRLLDLGAQEYLLDAAIVSIIAQRLARTLCISCKVPHEHATEVINKYKLNHLAERFNIEPTLFQAVGCEQCANTGYKGRTAVIEYLRCTDAVKALPKDNLFAAKAREISRENGGCTLMEDGFLKVLTGLTTVDEIARVAG